jgi:hypothetical protein
MLPQDAVPVDAIQGEASKVNGVSPLSPTPHLSEQAEINGAQLALIQVRKGAKREGVTTYKALKTHGYIREALEYVLMAEER